MRRSFLAVLLVLVLSSAAQAEAFKRVVLYQDRAFLTVERLAANRKLVVDAPPEMVRESLTVVPLQGGSIRSIGVEPKRIMSGRAAGIKADLDRNRTALEGKKRLKATAEREIELIFDVAGGREKEPPFSKTRLTEALSFIDAKVGGLNEKVVSLDREIEVLSLRVKDLEAELAEVSGRRGFEITIETDSERPVEVSYAVMNASWSPEYTVRADPAAGGLAIETKALMRQATGTDWEIGQLAVATGRPGFGIGAPELSPWEIGLSRAYRGEGALQKAALAAAPMAQAEDSSEGPEVRATAVSYIVGAARSVTLPGDGKPRTAVLQNRQVRAVLERVSAPKIDSAVFLRASAPWDSDLPLMPGSYTAFVEGEFTGRGFLKGAQPGEKISVDLGRDEGVTVERREKAFHERTLTGKDRTTYTGTMTVKNTRKTPARLTLKDQIPLSRDEAVRVDLVETSPKAVPDKDGILSWDLDLKPGAEAKVVLSFSVTGMPPL